MNKPVKHYELNIIRQGTSLLHGRSLQSDSHILDVRLHFV